MWHMQRMQRWETDVGPVKSAKEENLQGRCVLEGSLDCRVESIFNIFGEVGVVEGKQGKLHRGHGPEAGLRRFNSLAYFMLEDNTASYSRVANKKLINYPIMLMAKEARNSFLTNIISRNTTHNSYEHPS